MSDSDVDAYKSIEWIMSHSDEGFYFLIATERKQQEIVGQYADSNIAIYDYKKHPGGYSFNILEKWLANNPQAGVHFLLNFQLAIQDEESIGRLNFSRDMLARHKKNFVFCLTQNADDKLARRAYDFYSFIKLRILTQDGTIEDAQEPTYILDKSKDDFEMQVDFAQPDKKLLSQAISLMNQAKELSDAFRYRDALSRLQTAFAIREKILGENHVDTANACHEIAFAYDDLAEYDVALKWYEKALQVKEKALEWYGKALRVGEKVLGMEHPNTATTYNNMALVYTHQGEYKKALEWYGKALKIIEKGLGKEHPNTAKTYNNLAGVYDNQGEYEKALELYGKAQKICEKRLGKNHPHTKLVADNIQRLKERISEKN